MNTSMLVRRLLGLLTALAVFLGLGLVGEVRATPSLSPATQSVIGKVGVAITPTAPLSSPIFGRAPTFTVAPALPSGLALNTSTGVVTGTPVAELPRTAFTITGTDGAKQAVATLVMAVTVTGLPPAVVLNSSRPGCKPVTFAANVRTTLQAVDVELPSLDFACSVHVGIKKAGVAVAISTQGTAANAKVGRYLVTASRVGVGMIMKIISVQPPAQVLRRQFRPLRAGTWTVAITALAPSGATVGTWTSEAFTIN